MSKLANPGLHGRTRGETGGVLLGAGTSDFLARIAAPGPHFTAIDGTSEDDVLIGTPDEDMIDGLGGNDFIDGRAGADVMDGGSGDDTIRVDDAGDVVIEAAGGGEDRVAAAISYTLTSGAEVEVLTTTDQSTAIAIALTGNSLANSIFGNEGDNLLNGGGGADHLSGYGGNDVYRVDDAGDAVTETAGGGDDMVAADVSYALTDGAAIEVLTTTDQAAAIAIALTGNGLANSIYGNAGANLLSGAGGNDYLVGLGGHDELDGGGGNDAMRGGGGDDVYRIDSAADLVFEAAGEGNDSVVATSNYELGAGSDVETLTTDAIGIAPLTLIGNGLANLIQGNAGANILSGAAGDDVLEGRGGQDILIGGAGNDRLDGGGGNDVYRIDDAGAVVIEAEGGGNDTVAVALSYVLTAGASVETLMTLNNALTVAINLTGNEKAQSIFGNRGPNIIDGGLGHDRLHGGDGEDIFAFSALGQDHDDQIIDFRTLDDLIGLDHRVFTGLTPGPLPFGAYTNSTVPLQPEDRIIFDPNWARLYFDPDGNGPAERVFFTTVQHDVPTDFDFIVF